MNDARAILLSLLVASGAFAQARPAPPGVPSPADREYGVSVKDFGAVCDGTADDTAAIQKALAALGENPNRKLWVPGLCAVSGTVFIPYNAAGAIVEGTNSGNSANANYPTNTGFIAKPGSPGFQMFKVYAPNVVIRTLWFHCNKVATTGLVLVNAGQSVIENSGSDYCRGDNNQINAYGGPTTTITSPLAAGSAAGAQVAVSSATLPGQLIGGLGCAVLMLEYDSSRQETLAFSGAGNTLTLKSDRARYSHPVGATIQCAGNNNSLTLNKLQALYSSGGWGLNIFEGNDNNNITVRDAFMFGNAQGGELWAGSVNHHIGGHSEGNNGPALQLGDLNGGGPTGTNGRVTFGAVIEPFLDLENSRPEYNAVRSVCDGFSTVRFKSPRELLLNGPGESHCPSFPAGVSTLGVGYDTDENASPRFAVKSAAGMVVIDPSSGMKYYDNAGVANPAVVLSPTTNSSFLGVRATKLAGTPDRPACLDAQGNIYAGSNKGGILSCP